MPELRAIIRGAQVVGSSGPAIADIGIGRAGRIAVLGAAGSLAAPLLVDADGLIAIPGGVDLHVHINTWFGGTTTRDDFLAGSAAALLGGTTTFAQFAIPLPGETSLAAVERTMAEARGSVVSDYAVHGCVVRETFEESLDQLADLTAAGVGTVKVFSTYTDEVGLTLDQIQRLLVRCAAVGMTVFVHAETDAMVRAGIGDSVERGELGPLGHARSRTPEAEVDAVRTITDLAAEAEASVYFVHISSAQSVAELKSRRDAGAAVLAETCPHYLFLDGAVYARHDGQRWICSPPIRSAEHRAALWDGLRDGVIDTVSSDHNCFDLDQKGPDGADFRRVPNGLPGIEDRMPLLVGAAIDGRLDWRRLVQVTAETPARILGAWPRKGALAVDGDADIVLVDPTASTSLDEGHMATDYSPYAGSQSSGRIESVWLRGERVVDAGALLTEPGSGSWLPVRSGILAGA
jgi:dihydropyrimidinase